jgi:peptidoglycan/LPS O-acetylase OafA/YrhL
MQTHLRSDGLIIGVLISYLIHFTTLYKTVIEWKKTFLFIAVVLILPGFYFGGGSFVMNTFGLSSVNIGFGIITLISMKFIQLPESSYTKFIKIPVSILCFIGINSYSIYLWHSTSMDVINSFLNNNSVFAFILYFILSIIIGVIMSYLIEKPFLKLREFQYKSAKQ